MWRSLKNFIFSLWTYSDLSPDLRMRRHVNKVLRSRPNLVATEWHQTCWQSSEVSPPVSTFVYQKMQEYSGLEFGRVRPSDRLNEDLHLPLVCWFDWELSFCEAFWQAFGVDLQAEFDLEQFTTVEDLVLFLNQQLLSVNHW
ncbi:MAG: hypothetical protein IGS48_14175 [Oscillatoriales cyanobacterium C42_A2020_001]|nr:hypothetical protein [Leptolyngbyaceae cyanobacterium C42_A2020_001]